MSEVTQMVTMLQRLRGELAAVDVIDGTDEVECDAILAAIDRALADKADAGWAYQQGITYLYEHRIREQQMTPAQWRQRESWRDVRKARKARDQYQAKPARTITKEEHDALLDGPAPRAVDAEEYQRLMTEAQRGDA